MYAMTLVGLDDARLLIDAVLAAADEDPGSPVSVAVVDTEGELVAFVRQDGASHIARSMARRKAYTAARLGGDTLTLGKVLAESGVVLGTLDPEFSGFAGGLCIRRDGKVVGALGVSGRSEDDDEALAKRGMQALGSS